MVYAPQWEEPEQVQVNHLAGDGAKLLIRVELGNETLVLWRRGPDTEDPEYMLDSETDQGHICLYRRMERFHEGFESLREALESLNGYLTGRLVQ